LVESIRRLEKKPVLKICCWFVTIINQWHFNFRTFSQFCRCCPGP